MNLSAILVAAGSGTRFGADTPKQFLTLRGHPVIRHAAEALAASGAAIQPVGDHIQIDPMLDGIPHLPTVPGGQTRQDSVLAGLKALQPHHPKYVLVHDAARPIIPPGTIEALLNALDDNDGAIPAIPVADTLKFASNGLIQRSVPRENLFRAQTPQGFHFDTLLKAHQAGVTGATDDASLLEVLGFNVKIVPGHDHNIKLTYPADLARLEAIMTIPMEPRVGTGFDVHVFAANRPMILCGVTIPHDQGLAGHSDADVGIHALCDAIYGALAEGDIGRHFPPSENTWKDADSAGFLTHAAGRIAARGGRLVNADITLICERPKITPHAQKMRERLAGLLGIRVDQISVKATTTEKLGFTGRGEGIAAQAAVMLLLPA